MKLKLGSVGVALLLGGCASVEMAPYNVTSFAEVPLKEKATVKIVEKLNQRTTQEEGHCRPCSFASFVVSFEGSLRHLPLMHRRRCHSFSRPASMSENGERHVALGSRAEGVNVQATGAGETENKNEC